MVEKMLAYNTFKNTLKPYTQNVPKYCVDSCEALSEKHKEVLECVYEYYLKFHSHVDFLHTTLLNVKNTLIKYKVEYSEKGIELARERITPLVEKFNEQKTQTDKVSHAIIFLILEYIKESPFNKGLHLEDAPMLAVMGVNLFLVAFSSTLVAMAMVQKRKKASSE